MPTKLISKMPVEQNEPIDARRPSYTSLKKYRAGSYQLLAIQLDAVADGAAPSIYADIVRSVASSLAELEAANRMPVFQPLSLHVLKRVLASLPRAAKDTVAPD